MKWKTKFSTIALAVSSMLGLAEEPSLIFYLPFEKDATAVIAGGLPTPTNTNKVGTLVEGVHGQGMQLGDQTLLRYTIKGNYDNARGTLEFCFKYLQPATTPNSDSALFWEEGAHANRIYMQRFGLPEEAPFNRLWWRNNGYRLGLLGQQPIGDWHHVLLTWDAEIDADLYLDGKKVLYGKKSRRVQHQDLSGPRPTATNAFFTIGPRQLLTGLQNTTSTVAVVIDEFRVYNRMFTEKEAQAAFRVYFPVDISINSRVFEVGIPKALQVTLRNQTEQPIHGEIKWELTSEDGHEIFRRGSCGIITLAARDYTRVEERLTIEQAGGYTLRIVYDDDTRRFSRNFVICAVALEEDSMPMEMAPELKLKLVKEFDCTTNYGPEEFCDDGLSRVVDTPIGKYRATSAERPWSRFAYRFFIDHPQTPHLAVVEYPDDHEYEMEVMVDNRSNSLYQTLENGVIVGGRYPNSKTFKELRLLFWPQDPECTIMIMSWPIGCGANNPRDATPDDIRAAGVRTIRIYEILNGLPGTKFANLPDLKNCRLVGTREEDATSTREFGANCKHQNNGFIEIYRMLQRRMQYMNFVGQNLYSMTFTHYHGGFYPSEIIPRDFARPNIFPDYTCELALLLADCYKIKVNAGLHLRDNEVLTALGDRSTKEDIIAGRDTIYSIRHNGEYFGRGTVFAGPPDYNFMHPDVEQHILNIVSDILTQYGHFPAFNGFDFWFWSTMPLWFGSLENGYADMIIRQFEQDTGIKVPGDPPDPTRFTQRYNFLVKKDETTREQWIAWRCRKVTDFWKKIQKLVCRYNPTLMMNIEFWAIIDGYLHPNSIPNVWRPDDPKAVYEYYRQGGIDLNMLKDLPNLYFGNVILHNMNPQPKNYYARDFFLDPAYAATFKNNGKNAVWLEQSRREFDGMHSATPMLDYWLPEGKPGKYGGQPPRKEGAQDRAPYLNGHLEKSGAIMPNSDYYLEFYAKSLADWDVRQITDGGLTTTTLGAEDVLRDFIRAYRTLPAEYFEVFKDVNDPVCVRFRLRSDGYYFYLVNREYYPVSVTLTITSPVAASISSLNTLDLPANTPVAVSNNGPQGVAKVDVGPYRLRVFKMPKEWALAEVNVCIPREHFEELRQRKMQLESRVADALITSSGFPKMVADNLPWFQSELQTAWEKQHYARLRNLLDSYWAKYLTLERHDLMRLRGFWQAAGYAEKYFSRAPKTWQAQRVTSIPPIDSPAWHNAQAIAEFANIQLSMEEKRYLAKPADKATRVFCAYDQQHIGFLFECEEPACDLVTASQNRAEADLLEIMLGPNQIGTPYYYYRVFFDQANVYTAVITYEQASGSVRTRKQKLDFSAEFKKETDRWLARIVIPFHALGLSTPPQPSAIWRLNLVRQIRREGTNALRCERLYNPPQAWGVHAPTLFDQLIFQN